jgi:hypothetical protein
MEGVKMSNHWEDWKEVEDWNEWMRVVDGEEDEPTVLQQLGIFLLMVAVLFMFLCIGEAYWGV